MKTGILIIAHAPLASALRSAALHVFADAEKGLLALDVPPEEDTQVTQARAIALLAQLGTRQTLVFTDALGATPCNVAQRVLEGQPCKLIAGVNLPMLLRTVNYSHEPLDALAQRAIAGGIQGIVSVAHATSAKPVEKNP